MRGRPTLFKNTEYKKMFQSTASITACDFPPKQLKLEVYPPEAAPQATKA
jgi:hypothetical protein